MKTGLYLNYDKEHGKVYNLEGSEVYINPQATKNQGKGHPVLLIKDLEGSNGQKWLSLSRLEPGENWITGLKGQKRATSYSLTPEELKRVKELDKEKEEIITQARKRNHRAKELNKIDPKNLNKEELKDYMKNLEKLLEEMEK